jgi:copper chaperone CopZ
MTQLDVLFRYDTAPGEQALLALSKVRDVYGVRLVEVREAEKTVRVEYDASRLNGAVIHQLLRRAGIHIVETVRGSVQPEETAGAALG